MSVRRAIALVVLLGGLAAVVVLGRGVPASVTAVFADLLPPATPFAPAGQGISTTFFCPGVPASGEGLEGELVLLNTADTAAAASVTLLSTDQEPVVTEVEVPAGERTVVDVDELVAAPYVSAVVEAFSGRLVVDQRAIHPAGSAVAPCANATSSTWYFADGFTVDGSTMELVLTNPFPDATVVDISFVSRSGPRAPQAFQGYVLPGRSVVVLPFGTTVARDEPVLAVSIEATSGRFVAGRAQHYVGGGRLGTSMTLGAPSLDDQWWFADGETGEGIAEEYVVYNPTDEDVTADVVFLGVAGGAVIEPMTLNVPAGEVAVLDASGLGTLPDGHHGAVVSTLSTDSIVVERVITRPAGDSVATSVVLGSEYVSSVWYLPVGVPFALERSLQVLNATALDGLVTVSAIEPAGPAPLPGLTDIALAPSGVVTIDLPEEAVDRPLVVTSDVQVVVERLLPRAEELRGRSVSLAVPE